MPDLEQAIEQLIAQIQSPLFGKQARFSQAVTLSADFCAIDWLDAQSLYPRCYWQSRNAEEEVVALGAIHSFIDPLPAYDVIDKEQRLWGAKVFDGERHPQLPSYFFLPQVELIRTGQIWHLHVNAMPQAEKMVAVLHQLCTQYLPLPPMPVQHGEIHYSPSQQQWRESINKALTHIQQQVFEKVVLARQAQVRLPQSIKPNQLLQASRKHNYDSFHFLLAITPEHTFLGSTPERLYSRINNKVKTEALAGTIGRSSDTNQDQQWAYWLLHDEKNLRENQIVVDDIIERLQAYAQKIDVQNSVSLVSLREVQHLKRPIQCELSDGVKGIELLNVLQPTPAVAGLPREAAMAFIRDTEPFSRHWYSGSVGYFGHDKAEFCVAIRSAYFSEEAITLYAGAGIISGSDPDKEWSELNRKTATLLNLITTTPEIVSE